MSLNGKRYGAKRAAVQEAGLTKASKAKLEAFYKTRPEVMEIDDEMERLRTIVEAYNDKLNLLLPFAASAMRDVEQPTQLRDPDSRRRVAVGRGRAARLSRGACHARLSSGEPETKRATGTGPLDRQPREPADSSVMANRIWQHLLGAGIVESCDDFGKTGQPPANTALLNYLAHRFVANGWSVKSLVRDIASSRVYQLSTAHDARAYELDPANRLHSHEPQATRRRRPARLVPGDQRSPDADASDPGIAGASSQAGQSHRLDRPSTAIRRRRHRTVFRPILHEAAPAELTIFDFPNRKW